MPFYIVQLHSALWTPIPQRHATKAPIDAGWRMYARCAVDDFATCALLFQDPSNFSSKANVKVFLKFLTYLYDGSRTGVSWANFFQNGKAFHPVHTFQVTRKDEKSKTYFQSVDIFQFKKMRTDIRILFVQSNLGQFNIFISHVFEKDSDKTPASEKARAELEVQEFFDAIDAKEIHLLTCQGGKDAAPSFL